MPERITRKIVEIRYENGSEIHEQFDPLSILFEMGPFLIKNARAIREKYATSYRNVLVSASALVRNTQEQKMRAYVGFNNTPYQGAQKHCAEMKSFGQADHDGYRRHDAVIVVGPTDTNMIEGITGIATPTLYPCDSCLDLLDDATVVVTVGAEEDVYEAHTGAELRHQRYVLQGATKRKRQELLANQSAEAIHDPNFIHWTGGRAVYETLVSHFDVNSLEDLRLARAEAAVAVLQDITNF